MQVKPLDQIASKWSSRASAAAPAYQSGVQNPRTPWAAATAAADTSWATGVSNAVTNGRFKSGVNKAGDAKWQAGAVGKGVARYPQGVQGQVAQTNFTNGFQKFATVLQSLTLPPRMPKGDPANQQRAAAVATALRNAKVGH